MQLAQWNPSNQSESTGIRCRNKTTEFKFKMLQHKHCSVNVGNMITCTNINEVHVL